MPPKRSGMVPAAPAVGEAAKTPAKGTDKAKGGQDGVVKAAPEKGEAARASAKGTGKAKGGHGGKKALIGTRVRVECSDGSFYEGNVDSWDAGSKEYRIVLDDGEDSSTSSNDPAMPFHL